jgi:hypothetical protein
MDHPSGAAWFLVILGLIIALIGLIWMLLPSLPWLGRLPGDIRYEGRNVRFYFPLMTCVLISLILSGLFWLIRLISRQ